MTTTDAHLTAEERTHIIRLLHGSQTEFLSLISGLTDARWVASPAPDTWSPQQIAEHLVLGEAGMLYLVRQALASPPNPDWEAHNERKTEFLDRVLPNRRHKATAPERLQPHHSWTREETISRYQEGRTRTLQFVAEIDAPLKEHTAEHPFPVFNTLNAYQWLLYIPLHNARHNQQIAELLKDLAE